MFLRPAPVWPGCCQQQEEVLIMEKTRKQELINQEALRLSGVFNTPIPVLPPERDKALDKVNEPPPTSRSQEREER